MIEERFRMLLSTKYSFNAFVRLLSYFSRKMKRVFTYGENECLNLKVIKTI